MRIYARYENEYPLYYDYDEGIGAPEKPIAKLVFHKVKEQSELENPKSNSNITVLKVSDGGYVAKAGLPFRLVRKDNGKSRLSTVSRVKLQSMPKETFLTSLS